MEIIEVIKLFWFFLPAGVANMAPVLFKWIKFLDYPIDFNKKISGNPIFGKNKTFRGLFFGILIAILIVLIQRLIYSYTSGISFVDYNSKCFILLGFLLGFGALFGDLVKSFFKRRLNIKPGRSWILFDQIDWILGAMLFASFYVRFSWMQVLISVVMFGLLHPLMNLLGYILRVKKSKF